MKQILFILLAVLSFSSQAQQPHVANPIGHITFSDKPVICCDASIKDGSDTLEINQTGRVHFIKIGNDVYEITRKTELKKVEPVFNPYSNSVLYSDPAFQFDNNIPSDTTTLHFEASPLSIIGSITDSNNQTYQFNEQTMTWKVIDKEQPKKKGKKK